MIAVRVPGTRYYAELEFTHDTGASSAAIPIDDLEPICGPFRPAIPVVGTQAVGLADGSTAVFQTIELEMAVLKAGRRISPFLRVPVLLKPDTNGVRLDGPFARVATYIASKPDGFGTTYISSGSPAWRLGVDIPYSQRPDAVPPLAGGMVVPAGTTVTMPALTPGQAALNPKSAPRAHWGVP